ncbi:hypothetical protein I305_06125 [Cryptococcus gattii E566]|uniref:Secreted protein n=1 Tax=Cryptococcus gattii EJB2 TaxID=1296103 RepID=A0ABR5BXB3_9TREE|nr:hypothetical protein I306_02669 [Cryptococcus gattii EJB2]KIY31437.1 hypothetical protein I305_06125 [Cryptococcus gattii E566]KJD99459.1 hypothetical protein I311_06974 [Cryptococcus gattii NT-10]
MLWTSLLPSLWSLPITGQMPSPPNATVTVWWMSNSRLPNGYLSDASSFPSSYLDTRHTRRKRSSILGISRMLLPTCWRMTIILFDHTTIFASFVKLNHRQRKRTTLRFSSFSLLKAGNGYSWPTVPANPSTLSFSTLSPPPTISKQPTFQLTGTTRPSPPSSSSP